MAVNHSALQDFLGSKRRLAALVLGHMSWSAERRIKPSAQADSYICDANTVEVKLQGGKGTFAVGLVQWQLSLLS